MFQPKIKEKVWSVDIEKGMIELWMKEGWYEFEEKEPIFVIDTPPPYPGPFWHIGAAISYAQQDIIARSRRMKGYNVLYPIGIDRNGIPVEWYVEKYEGIDMWKYPREKFVELCRTALDKYDDNMANIMRRLMLSGDIDHRYRTDLDEYRALTQATFIELWKRGLIYEANRPNNWCPRCRTTIADAEVEYKTEKGKLYYIKFPLKKGGHVLIATTRPELIAGCDLVLVHPEDDRYKDLIGKKVILPIYGREVKIAADKEVDPEFGTGMEMVCSYGDSVDVRLFRKWRLKERKVLDIDGKLTEEAGKYAGLSVKEAREKIVEDLRKEGLLEKVEEIEHKVPIHDKCKSEIEIISMPEYYLKQVEFVEELKKIADEMKWYPKKHKQRLLDWLNSITMDWPISRRRYYGTEIPLWYCKKCGYIHVPKPGRYYKPWKEKPGIKCPKCGSEDWKGEERTLDTWMDSSISVLYITGYKKDEEKFKRTFLKGEKLRPQGTDIIRTWLYYSLLRVYQLTGKRAFEHVWINGMGLDEKGRKMSKSLGNVIYPEEILDEYGGDALRFYSVMEGAVGDDYRISKERIEGAFKSLTKLLNIARYVSMFPQVEEVELEETDKWILSELNEAKERMLKAYDEFDPHKGIHHLRKFTHELFASHYIEMTKERARENDEKAKAVWYTLHQVLKDVLRLLAPIVPAITDYIWRSLYEGSVHKEKFPKVDRKYEKYRKYTERIVGFNEKIWKEKKERGLSLKSEIKTEVPKELKPFEGDLRRMHNIK
ncbi:valine--tRNA ligase [Nanoarchaeota archaeon]|nr:MAG: valine--tRNA ligase [Nanoarchaeota archaeon]